MKNKIPRKWFIFVSIAAFIGFIILLLGLNNTNIKIKKIDTTNIESHFKNLKQKIIINKERFNKISFLSDDSTRDYTYCQASNPLPNQYSSLVFLFF